jgi:hypothetical protein
MVKRLLSTLLFSSFQNDGQGQGWNSGEQNNQNYKIISKALIKVH